MRRKRLSSLNMFMVAAATSLLATGAQAQLNPPHDVTNGIGCTSCHLMTSTYPKMLPPLDHTPVDIDDTIANNVCWSCHNDVDAAHTKTHSSTQLGTGYGNWTVECWVCHNEHRQEQNIYNGSTYGKYIRRTIDLSKITGLAKTGLKPVVFTGPTTFADDIAPYNGVCEVCHTQTTHFTNDGSGDNHGNKGGTNCTGCHNHATSFQGGADHSTFIADDNETGNPAKVCSGCHTNYAANPETAHSACTVCHTTAPDLFDNTFATYNGQADDDGTSMFANMTAGGYLNVGTGRITDAAGNDITGNPAPFTKIKCGVCHAAKPDALQAGNHGGHTATDFPWDATTQTSCGTVGCHDYVANGNVVADIHGNTCTICHDNAGGGDGTTIEGSATNGIDGDARLGSTASPHNDNCLVCHPAATYDRSTVHHTSKNGYAAAGNCTQCHAGTNYPGDHAVRVSLAGNCADCHNGTQGTTGGIPLDATDATPAARKIHDACTTCHNTDNDATLKAPYGVAQAMPNGGAGSNNGGGSCEACHTSGFSGYHATVNHATMVSLYANCSGCHDGTQAPAGGGPVPLAPADPKKHDTCGQCHGADGRLLGSANGNNGGTPGGSDGGGSCFTCHGEYFQSHSHSHTFNADASCATCHGNPSPVGSNARDAVTAPFIAAGEVHSGSSCGTCHAASGALIGSATGKTSGASCTTCHIGGANTWTTVHTAALGTVQPAVDHTGLVGGAASCTACHGNPTPATSNARDAQATPYIVAGDVHATGCGLCHTGNNDGGLRSSGLTKADTVAAGTCSTCHTVTSTWTTIHDTATGAVAGVSHATRVDALATCTTTCHTATAGGAAGVMPYNAGDNKVHDACATCHQASGALNSGNTTYGGQPIAKGTCGTCHTAGYFPNHTHSHGFTATAACATCHGNPTPVTSNARDAVATPFVGAGEVHAASSCSTCHDANGALVGSAIGHAAATGCIDCHTDTWTNIHDTAAGVTHATRVEGAAACTNCHGNPTPATSNARDAQATPYIVAGDVHAGGCAVCHTGASNGALRSSGLTKADTVAKGTCTTCHAVTSTWTTIHDTATGAAAGVSHATRVDGLAACTTCHTATAGGAAGVMPYSTSDDKVHDACATCHQATGILKTGNTTYGNQPIAKGTCGTCHTATYFNSHTHHSTANNQVAYSSTVDRSQQLNDPSTACAQCHTDNSDASGTPLDSFTDILGEHVTGCARCHSYTDPGDGTPTNAEVAAAIATAYPTPVNCTTCHVKKLWSNATSTHGGHSASHFTWAGGCQSCHGDGSATEAVVGVIHNNDCDLCHTTGGPYNASTNKLGAKLNGDARVAEGAGGGGSGSWTASCLTCHEVAAANIYKGGIHHDTKLASNNDCTTCHDGTKLVQNHSLTVATSASCVASQCHTSTTAGTATGITVDSVDGLIHNSCRSCHGFDANLSGVLKAAPGTKGVTAMPNGGDDSRLDATPNGGGDCIVCHYGTGATAALRATSRVTFHHQNANTAPGNCDYCHYDHRPATGYSTANINAATGLDNAGGNVPTYLLCVECHVNPESAVGGQTGNGDTGNTRTNGYAGGNVTVIAYNKGTDTYKTGSSWFTAPTKSTVHTVPNTAAKIDNWGICISCHDGGSTLITGLVAPTVQPMHALPATMNNANGDYCFDNGTVRAPYTNGKGAYLPGRRLYNAMSNINYFGDDWRPSSTRSNAKTPTRNPANVVWALDNGRCGRNAGQMAQITGAAKAAGRLWDNSLTTALSEKLVPNPWTGVQYNNPYTTVRDQLPFFAAQTPATDQVPKIDIIRVTAGSMNGAGTTLSVDVTVSGGNSTCANLTLQTGAGNVAFTGTAPNCSASRAYSYPANGLTFNVVSSQPHVPVMYYPIKVPTAATAKDDSATITSSPQDIFVLANDKGSNLSVVAVGAVSKQSGAGTCGSVVNNTTKVTYTAGTGDAVCTFTYQAESGDVPGPSQATVTVTQPPNQPPAFGSASYNAADATAGSAYSSTVAQDATDPESDPITYSRNGGTCGGWASVAADGTISGTPANPGDIGACTVIVRASAVGGVDDATVNINVVAPPACSAVSVLQDTSAVINNTVPNPPSVSYSVATGSNTDRLLVIDVGTHSNGNNTPTFTVTYGGQALTEVYNANVNGGVAGRAGGWIGYCNESCLDAASGTTLSVTSNDSGATTDGIQVRALLLDNVQQSAPVPASGLQGFICNTFDATACTANGAVTYATGDQLVAQTGGYSTITYTISGNTNAMTGVTGADYGDSFNLNAAAPGAGSDTLTLTPSGSSREMGAAVVFQSTCNNN